MLNETLGWVILSVYALMLAIVGVYGMHRYVLVYLFVRHRHNVHKPTSDYVDFPTLTIQLPMFNEESVARRVIDSACRVNYPREKLEVQVLDDSNDPDAAKIARDAVDHWKAQGLDISYIHRTNRVGYKAGALAEGLKIARGEFIAIFDADFVPPPDLLHNVLHHFTDTKVGMVQVRWDHLNRDASLLTRGQAIFLDGHFVIEHAARNYSGRFMHFNGTAGVWRRDCINDAGGWHHDTLTEDLDLSYRAQMKGWQFVYLPQYCAPAELPPEMVSFKQQAHRWTKGSVQTAVKLLPRILRSKTLPFRIKLEAFFHLTNTIVYPAMVVLTLLMYPAFIAVSPEAPLKHHVFSGPLFGATLFVLATCSASTFFIYAQTVLFGKRVGWKSAIYLPYLMALGVGLSINNSRAVFEGLRRGKKKNVEFVRTPKYGLTGKKEMSDRSLNAALTNRVPMARPSLKSHFSKLAMALVEVGFGAYMLALVLISAYYGFTVWSILFTTLFAAGYFYVGFSTISTLLRVHRAELQQAAIEQAVA